MKKKDIFVIVLIAVVSAVFSIIISGIFFAPPEDRKQTVEVSPVILPELGTVDKRYFNENSYNPAQTIEVGTDSNNNPLTGQ